MHIAMVTDYYLPSLGGVQTAIKAAKESLESRGHEVTIFCPRFETSIDDSVVALPASPIFKPDEYPFTWPYSRTYEIMVKEFVARGIDIVHVHSEMFAALAGLRAAHDLNIPCVQTMHGRVDVYSASVLPLPSLSTRLLARMHSARLPHTLAPTANTQYTRSAVAQRMWRLMINQANYAHHVIVPSQHFADKLVNQGVSSPVTVISNGLEDSVLRRINKSQPRITSQDEPLRIMWCGRVSPEKRPDVFLAALSGMTASFTANMYGEGVAFKATQKLVDSLGLADRVTLHGGVPQAQILEAMCKHDLFVSSSYDFDNQPMVLLEAMASCLPAVVCDPDLLEMFPHGGAVSPTGPDAQTLAITLDRLADDRTKLGELQENLVSSVTAVSQNTHVTALLSVYESVLDDA